MGRNSPTELFMCWAQMHGIHHILIQSGRPRQNSYVESFNARFRDDCLNCHVFDSQAEARQILKAWRDDYNQVRPHGSIGRIPPAVFAARSRQERSSPAINQFHKYANLELLSLLLVWQRGQLTMNTVTVHYSMDFVLLITSFLGERKFTSRRYAKT